MIDTIVAVIVALLLLINLGIQFQIRDISKKVYEILKKVS